MEGRNGVAEQHQRRLRLAGGRVQTSRIPGEESLEKAHPLLANEGDTLVPRGQCAPRVRPREGHARDPEGVRDPVRIAELARDGDRLLGERERLLHAARRLQTVDVGSQAVPALGAVALRHLAGEFDVAVEVTAVHVTEGFDER
jgi:hypothetical protein